MKLDVKVETGKRTLVLKKSDLSILLHLADEMATQYAKDSRDEESKDAWSKLACNYYFLHNKLCFNRDEVEITFK